MRIKQRYLQNDSHLKIIGPVKKILDKFLVEYNYKEDPGSVLPGHRYSIEFFLSEDHTNFDELESNLSGFKIYTQVFTEYEKSDIEKAEWFIIETGEYQYPQPENDNGYLKATFDLSNYCELCGIGKVQNNPYRLKTLPKQVNNQFWGLHWEFATIFVRQETKNILEKEDVKSIRFSQPVLHKQEIEIESFYQLHIDTVLGKGFDNYNTKIITCKVNNEENLNTDKSANCCGSKKFHHPMIGGYVFDRTIFNNDVDIVQSNEYFGSGGSASKLNIVSKKVKMLIERNELKGVRFTPIMHERIEDRRPAQPITKGLRNL